MGQEDEGGGNGDEKEGDEHRRSGEDRCDDYGDKGHNYSREDRNSGSDDRYPKRSPTTPSSPPPPKETRGASAVPLSRRTICVLLLLLAGLLAVNFWVPIVHSSFDDTASGIGVPQHDFFQYYAGGHNWDLGLDPYLNHPGDARAIHHPRLHFPQISGYIYPPTVLPLMGALAHYRYDTARTIWLGLNAGLFALLIGCAVFVSKVRRLEVLTACVLLTLVSFPFFYHVHEGQIDMIVAALTISAFLLYPRWRGWPSAALLAVAIATKVSPVLILVVMVAYFRDWRFLLKTLACGAAVFAVSLAFVDFALYREYVVKMLPIIAGSDPSRYNQTPLRFSSGTVAVRGRSSHFVTARSKTRPAYSGVRNRATRNLRNASSRSRVT